MRWLKNCIHRIPKPVRASFWTICAILLAIAYYIALGCPTLFFRQEFRRAEKANLVGPSTIVAQLNDEETEFDKLIVGETEHGITFFGRHRVTYVSNRLEREKNEYHLKYIEKTGDMTLAFAPNVWGMFWESDEFKETLPGFIFTDDNKATKADVTIRVLFMKKELAEGELPHEEVFTAEAYRDEKGFFRFSISAEEKTALDALFTLSNLSGGSVYGYPPAYGHEVIATVRLYDEKGNLTLEREMTLKEAYLRE